MAEVRPYGPAIHEAIASGEVDRMREAASALREAFALAPQK